MLIIWTSVVIMARISSYKLIKQCDLITYAYRNFKSGTAKPLFLR